MRRVAISTVVVLVLGAVGLAAWPFVQQWRTGAETASAQADLRRALDRQDVPAAATRRDPHPVASPAATGQPVAEMTVPRFGADWSWVVVEGTDLDQLALGPGHYTGTPLPGARGNVAIAGHRAGHGDPFIDFDRLRVGDEVHLRQGPTTWTYALTTAPEIIPVTADWVLDPLPGRQLTLTTCWPRYGSSKRMYVRAELVDVSTRSSNGAGSASEALAQGS